MKVFFTLLTMILAFTSHVSAEFIPAGKTAHFRFDSNGTLCFGPDPAAVAAETTADLVLQKCGDGSAADLTYLTPGSGSKTPSKIFHDNLCISSAGAISNNPLIVVECSDDERQLWLVNLNGTISTADGNGYCITLTPFQPLAPGTPIYLSPCEPELQLFQRWNPTLA